MQNQAWSQWNCGPGSLRAFEMPVEDCGCIRKCNRADFAIDSILLPRKLEAFDCQTFQAGRLEQGGCIRKCNRTAAENPPIIRVCNATEPQPTHMKPLAIFLLSLFTLSPTHLLATTPDWSVDVSRYSGTMAIIGRAVVSDSVLTEAGAVVGAFIGEECRGVAELYYDDAEDNFLFLMLVYGDNLDNEPLTFRTYVPSTDQVLENANRLTFEEDATWGTFATPYHIAPVALDAHVTAFSLPNQPEVEAILNPDTQEILLTAYVEDPENPELDLSSEVAEFTLSPFAVVFREGMPVENTVTLQDFTQPITYVVVSGTLDTAYWQVSLTFRDEAITSLPLTEVPVPFSIYPNPAQDRITIDLRSGQATPSSFLLLSAQGRVVWQQAPPIQAQTLTLSVSHLPRGTYLLLGQTDHGERFNLPLQIAR
ncbi:MAG TPA: hypothetical protein DCR93_10005 [Cytophagales bacterium]|nr:hypothetical protein [Cytophagales bacterium]HAP59808.1 hypothetical protein [Cytophagales bacterium]